ncbi:MAG: T9SS type A sorting domain-containing protein [Chitinophagales bacterium]|nr:T9SS type A sorting domain-containing protein [Chitinophagales bacterium]
MNVSILLLYVFTVSFAQNEFYNRGSDVYLQKGALIHVQGEMINDNGITTGRVFNDGIIEIKTDLENKTGSEFKVGADATSTDRAVKFVGNGNQKIKGSFNTPGTASFYNLVIDKATTTDTVELLTNAVVEGSLVFTTTTTTTTYNPSGAYTNNGNKGLLKTYDSSNEYLLRVTNGNTDAIKGYPSLVLDGNPTTGFILTKGTKASNAGGLERQISSAATYVYPIGTHENGFNAIAIHFNSIPTGGAQVKGKFVDGTSNPAGYVGNITNTCAGCNGFPQQHDGYNRYFPINPCNGGTDQWFILNNSILDHGYWSFEATGTGYEYWIEAFANSYTRVTADPTNPFRLLRYPGAYNYDPSGATVDWGNEVNSIVDIMDLLTYSANMGCYTGNGVPGGRYTSFSHFGLGSATGGGALPVELLYLTAEPVNNQYIQVKWATSLEIDNKGFEVWRSTDAQNFTQIGWVDGHGNSTVMHTYTHDDMNVQPNVVYYYKLRQIDFDGTATETYIVSAMITSDGSLVIGDFVPNPSGNQTHIAVYAPQSGSVEYKLYDAIGRIVMEEKVNIQPGHNLLNFEVSNLAEGTYNAAILYGNQYHTRRLVVQR